MPFSAYAPPTPTPQATLTTYGTILLAGDLQGTATNPAVVGIQGGGVNGQVLLTPTVTFTGALTGRTIATFTDNGAAVIGQDNTGVWFGWRSSTATAATAGNATALPAAPAEYASVSFNGVTRKIPLYAV